MPGPLVFAVEQRILLRVVGGVRVTAHPQVDVVVVHAAAGIALVFVDEVLLQERHVDDLAPRAVQVDVLREGDRVAVSAHATRLSVLAPGRGAPGVGDGLAWRGVVDVAVERREVGDGRRRGSHPGTRGAPGSRKENPCRHDGRRGDPQAEHKKALPEFGPLEFESP